MIILKRFLLFFLPFGSFRCCCSGYKSCPTLCYPVNCSTLDFPVSHHLWEFAQTRVHWVGDAIQPFHRLSPPSPPSVFPRTRVFPMSQLFTSGGQSIGASASATILPMNLGLISFRIDWFDLLAVQDTLKNLLQHHSSKASIPQCSTFFMVQLSHPYITTRKP